MILEDIDIYENTIYMAAARLRISNTQGDRFRWSMGNILPFIL